jgi:hypothetical protein
MIAFQPAGSSGAFSVQWLSNLGVAQVNLLGSASPVVRQGLLTSQPAVYAATFQGAAALVTGLLCPVSAEGYECGPPRRTSAGASVQGACNCATGQCSCPTGAGLACYQGSGCGDTCSGHGLCTEGNSSTGAPTALCACSACWSGPTCAVNTCGSSSSGGAAKPFLRTPAGEAAVGVPVSLALALLLYLAWWRAAHPRAAWQEAVPRALRCGSAGEGSRALLLDKEPRLRAGGATRGGGYGSVVTEEAP